MYEDIKEQFREVIIHSQGIPNPQVDSLFARWESAKKKFIERFDGLIYEWPEPVEFTLDEKEKKRLTDGLLRRGFAWSDIRAGLNRLGAEVWEE